MNRSEVAALLALAAAYDQRTIGQSDVLAWHELLADTNAADAMAVVKNHYATQRQRLLPVDVIEGVKRIRNKRLDDNPMPQPPAELTEPEYRAWLRATTRAIADGELVTGPDLEPDPIGQAKLQQLIGGAFQTVEPARAIQGEAS